MPPVTRLDGKQRKYLRGLAHALEPVVLVGKGGVTPAVADQVDAALGHHELIKVRFVAGRERKDELVAELERATGAEEAGRVGHVSILFRAHSDPGKRRIRLPGA